MNSKNGFTFIELVIVIALVGILAAIFSPRLLHLIDSHRADAAAEQIASHLRLAQEYAISQHITHGVWFGVNTENRYSVYSKWDDGGPQYDPIKNPLKPGKDLIVDFRPDQEYTDHQLENVLIDSADFDSGAGVVYSVEFSYLGTPVPDGGKVVISKGSETRNIRVEAETGAVSIW